MSRIGKLPISIPAGVTVAQDKDGVVTVKGPKGELTQKVDPSIKMTIEDGQVKFEIDENSPVNVKQKQAFHGLYRALVNNMVVGVSEGYKKEMELVGVGYRVSNQGNIIEFALGYTHPIFIQLPKEVKVETKSERNQNPQIILESCDKQLLGLICAKIRSFRMPEPYKGKGILFKGEVIRRKSGKSASAKYAQVINDLEGKTLASASSLGLEAMPKIEQAEKVGELVAKKAQEAGVTAVVFDRNGYLYHGRVKSLADAARKGGLKF